MKKLSAVTVFVLIIFTCTSYAQDKGFGAGVMIGEPTGISAKYWLNGVNAFDYGLGSSLASNGRIHLHVDYLWHLYNVINSPETFALYYGAGVKVKTQKYGDSVFGIRGVGGITWFVKTAPLDVFAEVVPVLNLTPDVNVSLNAALGVRYFFE